eukprot:2488807-Alexandrium_andersonii.AAC.1
MAQDNKQISHVAVVQHHALRASAIGSACSDCSAAMPISGNGEQRRVRPRPRDERAHAVTGP